MALSVIGCSSYDDDKDIKSESNNSSLEKSKDIEDIENEDYEVTQEDVDEYLEKFEEDYEVTSEEVDAFLKTYGADDQSNKKEDKKLITVEVLDKRDYPQSRNSPYYGNVVEFDFKLINESDKDIKGARIYLYIYDLFGDLLSSFVIKESELNIPAKGYTTIEQSWTLNRFMDEIELLNEPLENLKIEASVGTVIYSDGEKEIINEF